MQHPFTNRQQRYEKRIEFEQFFKKGHAGAPAGMKHLAPDSGMVKGLPHALFFGFLFGILP